VETSKIHGGDKCRTGTYRLYPTNCKIPTNSEVDRTLLMAQQFLQLIQQIIPTKAEGKLTHAGHIKALQTIITEATPPRVDNAAPSRVSGSTTVAIQSPPQHQMIPHLRG